MTEARIKVATNNMMALPRNPSPAKTLNAAPGASVVLVQEGNLPSAKAAMRHLGPHRVPAPGFVDKGQQFSCVVLFDPALWEHVETHYTEQYDGVHGISLTRHVAATELRFKPLDQHFGFLSYHAVTAGRDRHRRAMRAQGTTVVRAEVAAFRDRGLPVILGTDQNGTANLFGPATFHARHRIDHIYGYDGAHVDLSKRAQRHIDTRSDHDVLVATTQVVTR